MSECKQQFTKKPIDKLVEINYIITIKKQTTNQRGKTMKKNKIAAAYNNNMNFINSDCVKAIEMYKKMEKENGLKLFPTYDYKKLGVAYHCQDANGEISITFFDRTKTTSTMDVYAKAAAGQFNIVGEDCVYYPAQLIGAAIVPNWEIQSTCSAMIMGSMNFETFVARMKI